MQKTFCDRCGGECVNFYVSLHASGYATTSRGQIADELYSPGQVQICRACTDALREFGIDFAMLSEAELEQRKRTTEEEATGYATGGIIHRQPGTPDDSVPLTLRAHP